jgi:hypothetical protein
MSAIQEGPNFKLASEPIAQLGRVERSKSSVSRIWINIAF